MLELRAVGPGLLGEGHQIASPIEITIVIGRYVSDEVRGLTFSNPRRTDWESHLCLTTPQVDISRNRCGTRVSGLAGGLPWTRDECANPGGDPRVE